MEKTLHCSGGSYGGSSVFDIVAGVTTYAQLFVCFNVEAIGNELVANDTIDYIRRGGALMIYGVYSNSNRVHTPVLRFFANYMAAARLVLAYETSF